MPDGGLVVSPETPADPRAWLLLIAVLLPAVAGLLTLLVPRAMTSLKPLVALLGPAGALTLIAVVLGHHGLDAGRVALPWMPALHLDFAFHADRLGAFFALLVSGIGCLIVLYGRAYLGDSPGDVGKFFPLMGGFMAAMLGLVLADDLLLMLLFWEMTSITSFLLIGWTPGDKKGVKNALQAFFTTGFGGLLLFGGLVWIGGVTGAWAFTDLGTVGTTGATLAAFGLIYAGIAAKSAQWPLHYWLPGAMLAPTPISAFLHSAAMVKAGIYLLARLWPSMSHFEAWPWVIVTLGSITMVLGAWIALQRDVLKQILAYTTISQLGLLACTFGLAALHYKGEPNVVWGNAQVLNHALYKAALFMLAGGATHALGVKALSQMRGWWHAGGEKRLYAGLFLAGLVALAALPGTFSFFAKEAFLYQLYHAHKEAGDVGPMLLMVATVFVSVCNVAILVRFAQVLLSRQTADGGLKPTLQQDHDHAHHDLAVWHHLLWVPAALLITLQFAGGLIGPAFAGLVGLVEATPFYLETKAFSLWYVVTHPGVPLLLSLVGIALGVGLGLSPIWRGIRGDIHDGIFPATFTGLQVGGDRVFRSLQTGNFRWYAFATLATFAFVLAWTATVDAGRTAVLRLPLDAWQQARAAGESLPSVWAEPGLYLVPGLAMLAAALVVVVRDRAGRVLTLGAVGFSVTGVFYLYAAPDLALTQLSVEIVSLVLFLLVLNLLPGESPSDRTRAVRIVVALVVGLTATATTMLASSGRGVDRLAVMSDGEPVDRLGDYFL